MYLKHAANQRISETGLFQPTLNWNSEHNLLLTRLHVQHKLPWGFNQVKTEPLSSHRQLALIWVYSALPSMSAWNEQSLVHSAHDDLLLATSILCDIIQSQRYFKKTLFVVSMHCTSYSTGGVFCKERKTVCLTSKTTPLSLARFDCEDLGRISIKCWSHDLRSPDLW